MYTAMRCLGHGVLVEAHCSAAWLSGERGKLLQLMSGGSLADGEVHGGGGDDGEGRALPARARSIQRVLAEGVQQVPPRMLACLQRRDSCVCPYCPAQQEHVCREDLAHVLS